MTRFPAILLLLTSSCDLIITRPLLRCLSRPFHRFILLTPVISQDGNVLDTALRALLQINGRLRTSGYFCLFTLFILTVRINGERDCTLRPKNKYGCLAECVGTKQMCMHECLLNMTRVGFLVAFVCVQMKCRQKGSVQRPRRRVLLECQLQSQVRTKTRSVRKAKRRSP